MKKLLFIIISFLILVGCAEKGVKMIEYKEAKDITDKGAILIDVRTPLEYDQGHIPKAVNIPLVDLDTISYDKNKKIIVYCRSGSRSKEAATMLIKLGYKTVYDLGSKDKWEEELIKT